MARARTWSIFAACLFVALGALALLSRGVFTAQLPTVWDIKYTDLKADLRALGNDPLDSRRVYLGTDQQILATSDGGATWTALQSFRDDKIALTSTLGEKSLRALGLIETSEEKVSRISLPAGEDALGGQAAPGEFSTVAQTAAEAARKVQEAEVRLKQAEEEVKKEQAELLRVQAEAGKWQPDDLTASQVEGIEETSADFVPEPQYSELADWLGERGLTAVAGGGERKRTLADYLKKHEAEGIALKSSVASAERQFAAAQGQIGTFEAQIEAAKAEKVRLDALAEAAAKTSGAKAQSNETAGVSGEPIEAATPVPEEQYLSGVTFIAVDPSRQERVIAATFDGIFLSSDKGQSWKLVYRGTGAQQSAVLCLAFDPSAPATVFGGTLSGLIRSRDGGATWERIGGIVADQAVISLAVHPFDSKIVLAGTEGNGLFRSADGGASWSQAFTYASTEGNSIRAIAFAPSQPDRLYLGTGSGVFTSADAGKNWEKPAALGMIDTSIRHLVVSPVSAETIFTASDNGVSASADAGKTFRRVTFGLNYRNSTFLSFDPLDPATVWLATNQRVCRSTAIPCVDLSQEGKAVLLGSCEFTLDGQERHAFTVDEIDETGGVLKATVQSEAQKLELKLGESKPVDLDGDGNPDAVFTFTEMAQGTPRISVETAGPAAGVKKPSEVASLDDLEPYFAAEPTWVEVQEAASRWAEVHPDKIAAWRRGASLRAFVPEFAFGFSTSDGTYARNRTEERWQGEFSSNDFSGRRRSSTRVKSDEVKSDYDSHYLTWGWGDSHFNSSESGSFSTNADGEGEAERWENRVQTQNDDTSMKTWDIRLDWDLRDFLYSKEQMYISREARDLSELRQDVLEQVTVQFFDRRSARIDMILNPPADPYSKVEMLLRIQQLDASLDALTGGFFTRTITERQKDLPPLTAVTFIRSY
jgi:photosystem II stability/assembly factor-like uncharacterized protein